MHFNFGPTMAIDADDLRAEGVAPTPVASRVGAAVSDEQPSISETNSLGRLCYCLFGHDSMDQLACAERSPDASELRSFRIDKSHLNQHCLTADDNRDVDPRKN
jgi:hypothetical protein